MDSGVKNFKGDIKSGGTALKLLLGNTDALSGLSAEILSKSINPTNLLNNGNFDFWTTASAVAHYTQDTQSTYEELGDVTNTEVRLAQKIVLTASIEISKVAITFGSNTGSPSGNVTLRIETNSGGNLPTGTLANASATKGIAITASAENTWLFDTPFTLAAGTYWIVLTCANQDTNYFWRVATVNPLVNYTMANSTDGGASWAAYGREMQWKLYRNDYTPDGWTLQGANAVASKETTTIKYNTNSCKITRAGTNANLYNRIFGGLEDEKVWNKTLTISAWVKCSSASCARLNFGTNLSDNYSSYHTGGGDWELLTKTITVESNATYVAANLEVNGTDTSAYFDSLMIVEGSIPFSFAPKKPDEGVWANYGITSTIVGFSTITDRYIYIKKIGKTVFVSFHLEGTSNDTETSFTLPFTSANTTVAFGGCCSVAMDNNSYLTVAARMTLGANVSKVYTYKDMVNAAWTASGTKLVKGSFWYECA